MIASPRTDSIEDRAEKKWLDEKVEGRIVTLPKEIIQVFGLIKQSDEVNEFEHKVKKTYLSSWIGS
jgi:hypothetical protein